MLPTTMLTDELLYRCWLLVRVLVTVLRALLVAP